MHQPYRFMKTIELEEAYELLLQASAIGVENYVVIPDLGELDDDEDNIFLELTWNSEDGLVWNMKFIEGDNKKVEISGSKMYLHDTASEGMGDTIELELLIPMQLD
jgi:hypothetical protein